MMSILESYCRFFFFQAEDGIRDYKVTGVQTCALPIWTDCRARRGRRPESGRDQPRDRRPLVGAVEEQGHVKQQLVDARSEEHTSELQAPCNLVCRLLLEKKKKHYISSYPHVNTARYLV